jgi:hypothetical protein
MSAAMFDRIRSSGIVQRAAVIPARQHSPGEQKDHERQSGDREPPAETEPSGQDPLPPTRHRVDKSA